MYRNSRKKLSSDKEVESEVHLTVSKDSLIVGKLADLIEFMLKPFGNEKEAIALVYQEGSKKSKDVDFGGTRTLKKCHLASLKAHNLCSAADIFSPEPSTAIEILDELRLSLLEDNFSISATLLKWLSHSSSKLFLPVIWKSAAVLFLNHYSFEGCHEEFLETCADQRLPEDKRRLFKALVSLPDVLETRTKRSLKHDQTSLIKPDIDYSDDEY